MSDPTVCAVMLTRDRPEMAARAVRCFRRQTYGGEEYGNLHLLIVCPSTDNYAWKFESKKEEPRYVTVIGDPEMDQQSVGASRNFANSVTDHIFGIHADVICHWDDDDISRPHRIAEQVALLQSSGADCVGYREMLFWETMQAQSWMYAHSHPNYCLGTSLCYWRKAWENCKFPPTSRGEDLAFVQRVRALGVSGVNGGPRMIATIHGGNTSESYDPRLMAAKEEWRRTPEWDATVRKMMEEA